MINLSPAEGSDVCIQFKHALYLLASAEGHFIPISHGTQEEPGPPVFVDRLEGRLRKQDEQWILSYASPIDPTNSIDLLVDPENVCCVWVQRRIQVANASGAVATMGGVTGIKLQP